jgi:hypothetical protein
MPVLAIGGIELVLFLIALAALLVVFTFHIWMRVVRDVLSQLPLIGGYVSGAVNSATNGVMGLWAPVYDKLVHPVAQWIWAYAMAPWHLAWHIVQSVADAKGWAVKAQQDAQGALASGLAAAAAAEALAVAHADALLGTAETYADNAAAGAEQYANVVGTNVLGAAEGLYNSSIAHADTLYNDAIGTADALYNAAIGYATQVGDDVRSEAVNLFGFAETGIRTLEGQVLGIPAEITGAIEGVVPAEIARALAAAGVASIPALLSRVATLEAEATRCLEPLCDTVTPQAPRLGNLGQFLQGLEDLAIEGIILALAAECLTNPSAVVTDVSTVVHDVGDVVMTGYRDLIGV